jgi:hypothetical protein
VKTSALWLQARNTLTRLRLRALMKRPQSAGDQMAEAFLREAETIELDHVFPDNTLAPSVRANDPGRGRGSSR